MKNLNLKIVVTLVAIGILFFNSISSYCQYQERSYDLKCGAISGLDFGRSIINRIDNGYAIAGFSYASGCGIGPFDWMFVKVKPSGVHESIRLIGTLSDDKCYSLIQSSNDSGYVLAGNMYVNSKNRATFVKLNKSSTLLYSKRLDDSLNSQYFQVIADPSNTWGFTGWDERDIYGKKRNKILATQYTSSGIKNWGYRYDSYVTKTTISRSYDEAYSICFQPAGGAAYGIAARTSYFSGVYGTWDIMLVKLSYSGSVIWNKTYRFNFPQGHFYPSTEPRKIIPMSDGGFVVVGFTNAHVQSESDIIVFRVNANGGLMWSYCYGNTNFLEYGHSIVMDGNHLVITGARRRSTTPTNALLMKIPLTGGAPLWTKIWDVVNPDAEAGYDLVNSTISAPDGYAVTGETYRGANTYDPFLWRTNVNGVIPGVNCEDSAALNYILNPHKLDSFLLVRVSVPDRLWTPAVATPQINTNTICLLADDPTGMEEDNLNEVTEFSLKQNYPNPFNPTTKINYELPITNYVSLKVYDVNGKEVMTLVNEEKSGGRHQVEFNGSNLSSGIYYYKLVAGNFVDVKKMILLK